MSNNNEIPTIYIGIHGGKNVGKSAFINQLVYNKFETKKTKTLNYATINYYHNKKKYEIHIRECNSDPKFNSINKNFVEKKCEIPILFFDLTNYDSYHFVLGEYLKLNIDYLFDMKTIIIVGTKNDLKCDSLFNNVEESLKKGNEPFKEYLKFEYFGISNKSNENVKKVINYIIDDYTGKYGINDKIKAIVSIEKKNVTIKRENRNFYNFCCFAQKIDFIYFHGYDYKIDEVNRNYANENLLLSDDF